MAARLDWGRIGTAVGAMGRRVGDAVTWLGRTLPAALWVGLRAGLSALWCGARRLVGTYRANWERLSHFRRHFIANLFVGLLIAVVLHLLHQGPLLHTLDDAAIDWTMRIYGGTAPPAGTRPIAFIDIDDATWQAWGEPLLTPRDPLAALLRHAIDGAAAAIVLDIDLSHPGGAGDQALAAVLRTYLPDATGQPPNLPPLILARDIRLPPPGSHALPTERQTPFDDLVERAPGIHWAAPLFERDGDGRIRRWRLWTATCGSDGQPRVRPSIQLLLAGLLDGTPAQQAQLAGVLRGYRPSGCGGPGMARGDDQADGPGADPGPIDPDPQHGQTAGHRDDHGEIAVRLGEREIHLEPHGTAARVIYREPWRPEAGKVRSEVTLDDGRRVPAIAVRPAAAVVKATDPRSGAWLQGHVAIVGGSHRDTRDIHMTPLGWMPGALILANAVQSLGHHGELRTPSLAETLAVEAFLILIMSALFARFDSLLGSLLSGLAVILVLLPLSLAVFGNGTWLSFAIPLIAIMVHKLWAEIEALIQKVATKGHSHERADTQEG